MSNEWIAAVKAEMHNRQMSQRLLASLLHVEEGTFNHYLNERREAPFTTAQQAERVLGVPLDLWYASRGQVPDDLMDRYGVHGLATWFERMREDTQ